MRSISLEDGKLEWLSNLNAGDLRSHDKFGNKIGLREILGGVSPQKIIIKLQADLYNESVISRRCILMERISLFMQEIRGVEELKQKQRLENTTFRHKSKIVEDESYPGGYKFVHKQRRPSDDPQVIAEKLQREKNARLNRERKARVDESRELKNKRSQLAAHFQSLKS